MSFKKTIISTALTLLSLLCLTFSVSAASLPRLNDAADLIPDTEESAILTQLDAISAQYGIDVIIVTTNDTDGRSSMEYADDYFDYNRFGGNGEDGVVLLVNMDIRELWISGTGVGTSIFHSGVIDEILDDVYVWAADGDYSTMAYRFAELSEYYVNGAVNGYPFDAGQAALIAGIIGLIAAFAVTASMRTQLHSVRAQRAASGYYKEGSLQITTSRDFYLYSNTTRIARDNGGNHSSGTHRSSSGRSHSGGGRRF